MRYCHASLSSLCLQPSYKFDKEGSLLFIERHENLFRVTEAENMKTSRKNRIRALACYGTTRKPVFVERWCRLRGNLLFYMKSREPFSEPFGVIVLDIAEIRLEAESPPSGPFYFNIIMSSGKSELVLGASTESERDSWVQSLHMASYSYMKAQADALRLRVTELQGQLAQKEPSSAEHLDCENPAIEVAINCDNLRCDANGCAPDTKVVVSYKGPSEIFWKRLCQTEVVKTSANPCFLRTCHIPPSLTEGSKNIVIRFTVNEVKEISTETCLVLGQCELPVKSLVDTERLRLPVVSAEKKTIGFVTLTVWVPIYSTKAESLSGTPKRMSPEHESKRAHRGHRRAHSLPPKLYVKLQVPAQAVASKLLANPALRTYRFHSGLGGDIMVHETLFESRLNNCIPMQLIRLWILEEKELVREVAGVAELRGPWNERYVKLLELHIKRVAEYATALEAIDCRKGVYFRKSIHKTNHDTLFLPVNLHVQRFAAQNDSLRRSSGLDVVTAGAFTAASLGFKGGGLLKMIEQSNIQEDAIYFNKLNVAKDTILAIRHFRREIVGAIQRILVASRIKDEIVLIQAANDLITKSQHLTSLIEPKAASDALSFYEENRAASNVRESNGDLSTAPLRSIAERIVQELRTPQVEFTPFSSDDVKEEFSEGRAPKDSYPTDTHSIRCGSPPSHYYSSLEEPEPIELTCVNIEASLLALAGKISQICDVDDSAISDFRPLANLVSKRKTAAVVVNEQGGLSPLSRPRTLQLDSSPRPLKDWAAELKPSLKKLHHSANCLLKTARLVHTVLRLRDDPVKMNLQHAIQLRRDACFSQALTSAVTALMVRLWCSPPDPAFLSVLAKIGPLLFVEGLLTSFKAEKAMLSDMMVAVDDLKSVQFTLVLAGTLGNTEQFFGNISSIFRRKKARNANADERARSNTVTAPGTAPIGKGGQSVRPPTSPTPSLPPIIESGIAESVKTSAIAEPESLPEQSPSEGDLPKGMAPVIRGSRSALQVVIPVPEAIFSALPADCISQSRQVSFSITPVLFNVGFNEFVPIAEKLGEDELEKQLNCDSFLRVHDYCKKFLKLSLENQKEIRSSTIGEKMKLLKDECLAKKSKNMKVHELMEVITRKVYGFQITSCKSAKDRTGMAVTLGQCNFLSEEMELSDQEYQKCLDAMRSEGTRIENCAKNIGPKKFAFQWLQLLAFPHKYRPPPGSFGSLQT